MVQAGGVALQANVKQYLRERDAAASKVFAAEVVDRSNGTFEVAFIVQHACDFEVRGTPPGSPLARSSSTPRDIKS